MKSKLLLLAAAAVFAVAVNVARTDVKQPQAATPVAVDLKAAPQPSQYSVSEASAAQLTPLEQLTGARGDDFGKMLSLLVGFSFFAGMINYIQPGNAITAAAPYQRNTGQGTLLGGNLFGVAVDTVASGATGVFWTEGVYELTKLSGTAETFTLGKRVFWDDTNKRLTVVSTSNVCVGVVTEAAATDAVVARIKIWPSTPAGT